MDDEQVSQARDLLKKSMIRVASGRGEHREMFSIYKVPQRGYGNIMASVTVDQRVKIVNNGGTMHE